MLKDGKHGFEFVGRCGRGSELGFLLCFLVIEDLQLGMLLFELPDQELPLNGDLRGGGAWRRLEAAQGIGVPAQGRLDPGDIELGADQIVLRMLQLGFIHGGVEFDQNVSRLDALAVANMDGPDHAGLERLDDLGTAGGNDLSGRRGDDVQFAE